MGAQRGEITREAMRFHYLITQLENRGVEHAGTERRGMSQREMAEAIGCHQSLISKWRNPEGSGRSGIGAEIIRGCKDGLQISPDYFYEDYEGERDFEEYRLGRGKRAGNEPQSDVVQKQLGEVLKRIGELTRAVALLTSRK